MFNKFDAISRRKNPIKKILKLSGIASAILIIILGSFYIYHKVEIKKAIIISFENHLNGLTLLDNENLFTLNIPKSEQLLQSKNSTYYSVKIRKQYPQTLVIETQKRTAVAKILNITQDLFIDAEGVVFVEKNNRETLPVISFSEISIYPGQKTDWRTINAVKLILECEKQSIKIDQITSDDKSSSFIARVENGIQVLLPFSTDMRIKVSSLQLILMRFRIEGKNISKIDFRFDKPVVTLANGEKISSPLPSQEVN